MADLIRNALRRKIAAAEAAGDSARVELLRERMAAPAPQPEPVAAAPEAPEAPEPEGLDAVAFASPAARAAAEEAGLTAESFKRRRKSGESGFTKPDVERIAATATDED